MKLLRLKISPEVLVKKLTPDEFSFLISYISTGFSFKTTSKARHPLTDALIIKYAKNKKKQLNVADVGVSDGQSALELYYQLKKNMKTYVLLDKYINLKKEKKGMITSYINVDGDVVYTQIGPFLFHTAGLLTRKYTRRNCIDFTNPKVKKEKLKIEYFDIFTTTHQHSFDIIKCANILNLDYFSPKQIAKGLQNMKHHLKEEGYLFITHNNKKYKENEAILILQRKNNKLLLVENIHRQELASIGGLY